MKTNLSAFFFISSFMFSLAYGEEIKDKACNQSPVVLANPRLVKLSQHPLKFFYGNFFADKKIGYINSSHQFQILNEKDNFILLEDKALRYDLVQFHFHSESEHVPEKKANSGIMPNGHYPLELHFVHIAPQIKSEKEDEKKITVIGVFIKEGKENPAINHLFEVVEGKKVATPKHQNGLNLSQLLPKNFSSSPVYRYTGSLTAGPGPGPYLSPVEWRILQKPIEASKQQIQKLIEHKMLHPQRATQPLCDRPLFLEK